MSNSIEILRIPIAKSERRDRQNLVFGWANVPYPVAKAFHQHLDEGMSLEQVLEHVRGSFSAQFPNDDDNNVWRWVMAVFIDHVIVEVHDEGGTTFLRHSLVGNPDDDGFIFGEGIEVERTFVVKAMAEFYKSQFAPKIDLEGDLVDLGALEKAAYAFTLHSGRADIDHDEVVHGGLVESVVITDEKLEAMGVPADARDSISKGWWLGFEVDDPTMDRVESGDLAMFSIGGSALRTLAVE